MPARFCPVVAIVPMLLLAGPPAHALVIIIRPGPEQIYLQVGDGAYITSATAVDHRTGAIPAANPLVNLVTVDVPASQVGTGIEQRLVGNSAFQFSFFDRGRPNPFPVCRPNIETYVGGWWRSAGSAPARMSVSAPLTLDSGVNSISFNTIRWSSSAFSDPGAALDIGPGRFIPGGTLALAAIPPNQWWENCHTFFYNNLRLVPPGTYRGRVTYTLASP